MGNRSLDCHRFFMFLISICLLFQLCTGIVDILFLLNILQTNTTCQNYWSYIVPSAVFNIMFSMISLISVRIIMRNTYVNHIRKLTRSAYPYRISSIYDEPKNNNMVTEDLDFTILEVTIFIISAIGQIIALLWSLCVFFIASTPCYEVYPIKITNTTNTTNKYTYAPQSIEIYYGFHFGMMLLGFLVLGAIIIASCIGCVICTCSCGTDPLHPQPSERAVQAV